MSRRDENQRDVARTVGVIATCEHGRWRRPHIHDGVSPNFLTFTFTLTLAFPFLSACDRGEAPRHDTKTVAVSPAIEAAVVAVRAARLPIRVEVTGQVTAQFRATLSSQLRGVVQEVPAAEGVAVKKGQPLVRLDQRDVKAALARAEAEHENAGAHLARMERLFQEDSVARQELENARRAHKVAEAGRRAALAQLSHTVLSAPFDGIVTERNVEVGELASPGQPLVTIEAPTHLRLVATVAEGDLKAVRRGDTMPVIIDALGGDSLKGTITQILPAGDPVTHTFVVKVDLPPVPGLKSGMFGRLQLNKGDSASLVVPAKTVVERGQLTGVFVVGPAPDSVAHLRWVTVGRRLNGETEVLSGVNAGEQVLADASLGVDGAKIRIAETAP